MLQEVGGGQTPLQRRLDQLGRALAIAALAMVVIVFGMGLLIGEDWQLMLMTAISMAVAVVPEGLPAVVTIALALGAQRMLKRQALIRKLPAVETLGSVTVICSDKTGTLTENRMTVTVLDLAGHRLDLTEEIRRGEPVLVTADPSSDIVRKQPSLALLLIGGALANDASLQPAAAREGQFHAVGDPTEGAMVVAAARFGLWKDRLEHAYPRVAELPFDSDRKRMTTVHQVSGLRFVDPGLRGPGTERAGRVCQRRGGQPAPGVERGVGRRMRGAARSRRGGRRHRPRRTRSWPARACGCSAWRSGPAVRATSQAANGDAKAGSGLESDLVLIGLIGMIDPPRPEVKDAVVTCRAAGIRPVMITGDHPLTARQIAYELGISSSGRILTGQELAGMSVQDLEARGRRRFRVCARFARAQAEHRAGAAEPRARGGDDRRRGERCPGAEAGGHRRRNGHHRDGRIEGSIRDGAARRQLYDDRGCRRRRPRHLRQHPQVHPVLTGR